MLNIILTSYNRPTFVRRTIESLLAQTNGDFFCHIMDDNSNDETLNAIRKPLVKAQDPRFKLYIHDTTAEERRSTTRYSVLINSILPQLTDGVVGYLCDNVEYHPRLVADVLEWFDANPDKFSAYVTHERDAYTLDGERIGGADALGHWNITPPHPGTIFVGPAVHGMLDHSQVFHRVPTPLRWNEDVSFKSFGDGAFFMKLIDEHGPIYPINTGVIRTVEHLFR